MTTSLRLRSWVGRAAAAVFAAALAAPAVAVDAAWSGFGTVGYAITDSPAPMQRFIDRSGGFERDSLVAGQLDLRFDPRWSATVQAKIAPASDDDDRIAAHLAWAFVAWRATDEWLLRAGRVRLPLYLHSESLDVGISHDMARLPHEMYSIAPTNDVNGFSALRTVSAGERDWTIDLYAGRADLDARLWTRDGAPPLLPPGPVFLPTEATLVGGALGARDPRLNWRVGLHAARVRSGNGPLPVRYPRVDLAPGLGFWQVDSALPGPGVVKVDRVRNLIFTAGAELQLDANWRVAAEFVRRRQFDTEVGGDSTAGYVALFRRFDDLTVYGSVARQLPGSDLRRWHRRLTGSALPDAVPGAAQINGAQRLAAELLYMFDQRSVAFGASYALSPRMKIKGEWMGTRVGAASNLFDTPPGREPLRERSVQTLSANLSIAF